MQFSIPFFDPHTTRMVSDLYPQNHKRMLDSPTFFHGPLVTKFSTFLNEVANQTGKTASHAKDMHTFFKRKQDLLSKKLTGYPTVHNDHIHDISLDSTTHISNDLSQFNTPLRSPHNYNVCLEVRGDYEGYMEKGDISTGVDTEVANLGDRPSFTKKAEDVEMRSSVLLTHSDTSNKLILSDSSNKLTESSTNVTLSDSQNKLVISNSTKKSTLPDSSIKIASSDSSNKIATHDSTSKIPWFDTPNKIALSESQNKLGPTNKLPFSDSTQKFAPSDPAIKQTGSTTRGKFQVSDSLEQSVYSGSKTKAYDSSPKEMSGSDTSKVTLSDSSNKFDDTQMTRSASVDLFLNSDRTDGVIYNSSSEMDSCDQCTYIATAPVISPKQYSKSLPHLPSSHFKPEKTAAANSPPPPSSSSSSSSPYFLPSTPPHHYKGSGLGIAPNTRLKYATLTYPDNSRLTQTPDEASWSSPPSINPCFLQYKLAKQYSRNLQLPGVIGLDLDSESMDEESELLKQDMKRFFARIYPSKGTRYTALSDYLKHYPQCILDLLQGPFGHTAFENALHLRCFNDCNFVNYSAETKAHEVIIPPPDYKKPLRLWTGTYGIPRDDKRHRGGEDVWFAYSSLNAMGIADGISEWMDLVGVNPREFAEDLLKGALEELYKLTSKKGEDKTPTNHLTHTQDSSHRTHNTQDVNPSHPPTENSRTPNAQCTPPSVLACKALTTAYHNAKHYGSSTAIIGLLDPKTSNFGIANLGDSGCLILRRSSVCGQLMIVRRLKEMQHGFNVPYQFTHLPHPTEWEDLKKQKMWRIVSFAQSEYRRAVELGKSIGDSPADIQSLDMTVCDGDLIIIGSDGLFDNLFDYEITSLTALAVSPREAQLLYHNVRLSTSPKDIARSLALAAYWKSLDPQAKTPFSKHSRKYTQTLGLLDFNGGKEDDISLAVAWVTAT